MNTTDLGKELYRTKALPLFRWIILLVAFGLFIQLLLSVESFGKLLFYPAELITYIISILMPAVYFALIRATKFYENGIVINRGLPYFDRVVKYSEIKGYYFIHPKHLLVIRRKDIEDELVISICDIDRAIAIFDQHHIPGDLGEEGQKDRVSVQKKFIFFFVGFSTLLFVAQWFGLIDKLLRS